MELHNVWEMESGEIVAWLSQKAVEYGDLSTISANEGTVTMNSIIGRLEEISQDFYEEPVIRITAKLQYASFLLDEDNPFVITSDAYKAVKLFRDIINEAKILKTEADEYLLKVAFNDTYARACFLLGICYLLGNGCIQSDTNAEKYIRKAADAGLSEAEDLLDSIND